MKQHLLRNPCEIEDDEQDFSQVNARLVVFEWLLSVLACVSTATIA